MNVAMMQPAFMPWQGFFELVYKSDIFIFLDDFQFSLQSYQQRNRLFVNKDTLGWYTVPVKKSCSFKAPLDKVRINEIGKWREKTWKRIEINYSKAHFFSQVQRYIKEWLFAEYLSLAAQNIAFIKTVCLLLDINREFRYSSQCNVQTKRSQRVLDLLRLCKARRYFCAQGAFDYMLEDKVFPVDDVEVLFQDFSHEPYPQVGSTNDFFSHLSILDAIMNIGPDRTLDYVSRGTKKWMNWNEMREYVEYIKTKNQQQWEENGKEI